MPTTTERLAAMALAGGRLAIGAGIWLAPRPTLRALGFAEPASQTMTLARIAGTRDLVLGGWQLASISDPERLGGATRAVAACDAGDALAFALLLAAGERRAGLRGLAGAIPATALGLWLGRRLRRPSPKTVPQWPL